MFLSRRELFSYCKYWRFLLKLYSLHKLVPGIFSRFRFQKGHPFVNNCNRKQSNPNRLLIFCCQSLASLLCVHFGSLLLSQVNQYCNTKYSILNIQIYSIVPLLGNNAQNHSSWKATKRGRGLNVLYSLAPHRKASKIPICQYITVQNS